MVFIALVSRNYVFCSVKMEKLEEKKLAAVNGDSEEKYPRNSLLRDTNATGLNKNYNTQVSEDMEERVVNKQFQM